MQAYPLCWQLDKITKDDNRPPSVIFLCSLDHYEFINVLAGAKPSHHLQSKKCIGFFVETTSKKKQ